MEVIDDKIMDYEVMSTEYERVSLTIPSIPESDNYKYMF
jgi:hypothetical protein